MANGNRSLAMPATGRRVLPRKTLVVSALAALALAPVSPQADAAARSPGPGDYYFGQVKYGGYQARRCVKILSVPRKTLRVRLWTWNNDSGDRKYIFRLKRYSPKGYYTPKFGRGMDRGWGLSWRGSAKLVENVEGGGVTFKRSNKCVRGGSVL